MFSPGSWLPLAPLQLLVFAYQAFKLRQTVAEGREAISAAVKAAEASAKQADTAERALTIVERPYLFLVNVGVPAMPADLVNPRFRPRLQYSFHNYGRSPAKIRERFLTLGLTDNLEDKPVYDGSKDTGLYLLGVDKATPAETAIADRDLTEEQWADVIGAKLHVIFFGYVQYTDILGYKHTSTFGIRWDASACTLTGDKMDAYNQEYSERLPQQALPVFAP